MAHQIVHHICPHVVPDSDVVLVFYQNHEDLGTWTFNYIWHGPIMVCHMMITMTHDFIDDNRNPWLELSNGLYST
jgi:hypothetical protein